MSKNNPASTVGDEAGHPEGKVKSSKRGKNPASLKNVMPPNPDGLITSKGVRLTANAETVRRWESLTPQERGALVNTALKAWLKLVTPPQTGNE